jgi:hypothetical protein
MAASERSILSLAPIWQSRIVAATLRRDAAARGDRAWHVLRFVLGALLLTAALLKAHALATAPLVGSDLFASRWFVLAVVQVELLFGFWLIAGIWPVWAWRTSVALFAVFGAVSLSKALAGEASCGCFGRLTVSPWLTTGLNAAAATVLVWGGAPPPPQEAPRNVVASRGVGLRLGLDGRIGCRARRRQPPGGAP